jgi:hypothetical protein
MPRTYKYSNKKMDRSGTRGFYQKRVIYNAPNQARLSNVDLSLAYSNDANLEENQANQAKKAKRSTTLNKQRCPTIITTALPKISLSNPPRTCPALADSSLIEKAIQGTSGTIAKKLRKKTATPAQPKVPATIPIGTNTKSAFA